MGSYYSKPHIEKNVVNYFLQFPNIIESEGKVVNDKKFGEWKYYNINGTIKYICSYKDNKLLGNFTEFYPNGKVQYIHYYYNCRKLYSVFFDESEILKYCDVYVEIPVNIIKMRIEYYPESFPDKNGNKIFPKKTVLNYDINGELTGEYFEYYYNTGRWSIQEPYIFAPINNETSCPFYRYGFYNKYGETLQEIPFNQYIKVKGHYLCGQKNGNWYRFDESTGAMNPVYNDTL